MLLLMHEFFLLSGYGFSLGGSMFIKEIDTNGMVARKGELKPGDIILRVGQCMVLCQKQTECVLSVH